MIYIRSSPDFSFKLGTEQSALLAKFCYKIVPGRAFNHHLCPWSDVLATRKFRTLKLTITLLPLFDLLQKHFMKINVVMIDLPTEMALSNILN